MKTTDIILPSAKRAYIAPDFETIVIDNDITLQLASGFNTIDFGDPGWNCTDTGGDNVQGFEDPYKQ